MLYTYAYFIFPLSTVPRERTALFRLNPVGVDNFTTFLLASRVITFMSLRRAHTNVVTRTRSRPSARQINLKRREVQVE